MKTYDSPTDQATFYFIVLTTGNQNSVKAWTDNKDMAEFYMEFHNCKNFQMRKMSNKYGEIIKIINANINDEIQIYNLLVKDEKETDGIDVIQVPATKSEIDIMNDAINTRCASSMVDYSNMNKYVNRLKKPYQKALNKIGLLDLIASEIYNIPSKFTDNLQIDGLKLLFRLFSDYFS